MFCQHIYNLYFFVAETTETGLSGCLVKVLSALFFSHCNLLAACQHLKMCDALPKGAED